MYTVCHVSVSATSLIFLLANASLTIGLLAPALTWRYFPILSLFVLVVSVDFCCESMLRTCPLSLLVVLEASCTASLSFVICIDWKLISHWILIIVTYLELSLFIGIYKHSCLCDDNVFLEGDLISIGYTMEKCPIHKLMVFPTAELTAIESVHVCYILQYEKCGTCSSPTLLEIRLYIMTADIPLVYHFCQ